MTNILEKSVDRAVAAVLNTNRNIKAGPDEMLSIMKKYCTGAAAAAAATGFIPGGAGAAGAAVSVGFICSMYNNAGHQLNLNVNFDILKALASTLFSSVSKVITAEIAASTVLSLIPGGFVISSAANGLMAYYLVYYASAIFMNMISHIFESGLDIADLSEEELEEMQKASVSEIDFKIIKSEAKSAYKNRARDGALQMDPEPDNANGSASAPVPAMRPDHTYELHAAIDFGSTNSVLTSCLYEWNDDKMEWIVSGFNRNHIDTYPTIIVYRSDNPDNMNVEKEVYMGRDATNLVENQAMPAIARAHFKPMIYADPATDEYKTGVKLTEEFFSYLYNEFRRESYDRLPREILPSLKTTLHISTPVRASTEQIQLMKQIAQRSGFIPENGIDFIDTSRNEADCIKHLAFQTQPETIARLNGMDADGSTYMLFIDIGGSTTDIELIRQSSFKSYTEKGEAMSVLAMWPKNNIQRPLGGCEIDQAISSYLVKEGFLLPGEVKNGWENGNAKTRFRQFKESINNRLQQGMNVNNLGRLNEYAHDEDWNHAERRFNETTAITPEIYENEICKDYIDRMIQAIREVFDSTGVMQEQVDAIFVTGAGSRLYFIHDLLLGKIGASPLAFTLIQADNTRLFDRCWSDPAMCCAMGAITGVLTE